MAHRQDASRGRARQEPWWPRSHGARVYGPDLWVKHGKAERLRRQTSLSRDNDLHDRITLGVSSKKRFAPVPRTSLDV